MMVTRQGIYISTIWQRLEATIVAIPLEIAINTQLRNVLLPIQRALRQHQQQYKAEQRLRVVLL